MPQANYCLTDQAALVWRMWGALRLFFFLCLSAGLWFMDTFKIEIYWCSKSSSSLFCNRSNYYLLARACSDISSWFAVISVCVVYELDCAQMSGCVQCFYLWPGIINLLSADGFQGYEGRHFYWLVFWHDDFSQVHCRDCHLNTWCWN